MNKTILTILTVFSFLHSEAQTTLILQPDSLQGKDANIWYLDNQTSSWGATNTSNYGNVSVFQGMEWTWTGIPGARKGLIDFDISAIPLNSVILSAKLSLFAEPNNPDGGHNPLSGSNACFLTKISDPWEENTVTWDNQPSIDNTIQYVLAQSTTDMDNYLNIDVTNWLIDKYDNPSINHGLQLAIVNPVYYRKMVFASSDNLNPALRPKLEIIYSSSANLESPFGNVEFNIFPNPSSGLFTIQMNGNYSLHVFDLTGNLVYSTPEELIGNQLVDFSKIGSGVYLIEVSRNGERGIQRIQIF